MSSEFTGSFNDDVARDHDGHLQAGSFGNADCPSCAMIVTAHAQHQRTVEGSFSEGSGGEPRDDSGHLSEGSFGDSECPICRANA
jgi:hypothetical protein